MPGVNVIALHMELKYKTTIMDELSVERAITRISHQIIEKNHGAEDICLIGIKTRGYPLAKRVAEKIEEIDGSVIPVGMIDITMYRDDLSAIHNAQFVSETHVPFDLKNRIVVLVDDVIFTGRTARAALDAVMSLGRASCIQLFALIDRGHSELPIKATYVGKNIPTALNEVVCVRLSEIDGETSVSILEIV